MGCGLNVGYEFSKRLQGNVKQGFSGIDSGLSRRKQGFDSPWGYQATPFLSSSSSPFLFDNHNINRGLTVGYRGGIYAYS